MNSVLLVSTCKEILHNLEFVKPIEDILKNNDIKYITKNYEKISLNDLKNYSKVIICGTSLKDFSYMKHIEQFSWVKDFERPILGICAGMQIIGKVYGGKEKKKTEIGFFMEKFNKNFLGLKNEQEVYHLHNYYIDFSRLQDFEIFSNGNKVDQAVKHKKKQTYAVLFHPEVRNKDLILQFIKNG